MNPLLEEFQTPHKTAPFSKIKNEHFKPAFENAIAIAKKNIDAITSNSEEPTFENTVEALEYSGQLLEKISLIFFNLSSAETNDDIQKIAQEVSPLLSNFGNDVSLNTLLFERVKSIYDQQKVLSLNEEQTRLLTTKYKSFVRNGNLLDDENKKKLREIDEKLSKLSLDFGENVLKENNKYTLHIVNKGELEGLPEGTIEAAKTLAEERKKEGYIFTLDYPSYVPFITYSANRDLRKEISEAFGNKGFKKDDLDNQQIVLDIVSLRYERAKLLGYDNHAHFVLEERMASTVKNVIDFEEELLEKSLPVAKKEYIELCDFSKSIGGPKVLESWDVAHYTEKLKQKLFSLDDELLKPYFELNNVVKGAFAVANKLYGLTFTEVFNIDKYHKEVKTYEVKDENGDLVSIFYTDYFPRKGKRGGAWMTSFLSQEITKEGENIRPHISNVCNFTPPTATKPSLLTFNEVTTLFHEFGHGLHGMLANTTYPSLSGTNVYWDFVELPSQVMENWCFEKEALELFAHHYKTEELIPLELIEKIKEAANFREATAMVRQIGLGQLDINWHMTDPSTIKNISSFEKESSEETLLTPYRKEVSTSTAFSHIFQGGYAAGYYSYKWAEVLDADAFELFKQKGILNREVGESFKENILSKGGSVHPMELYEKFRGKKPDSQALLKRAGLI